MAEMKVTPDQEMKLIALAVSVRAQREVIEDEERVFNDAVGKAWNEFVPHVKAYNQMIEEARKLVTEIVDAADKTVDDAEVSDSNENEAAATWIADLDFVLNEQLADAEMNYATAPTLDVTFNEDHADVLTNLPRHPQPIP